MSTFGKGWLVILVAALSACGGGSKVLKEPLPMQVVRPLASASDARISVTLDWVIVRDNAGTWAKNADWDEYLVGVTNKTSEPVEIRGIVVVDSLGTRLRPQESRKALVQESKETYRRYKEASTKVMAGQSGIGLFATGTAMTVVGGATAISAAYGSILSGSSSVGAAGAVGTGVFLAGPVVVIGGIVRGANNRAVDKEIQKRRSIFPVSLAPGEKRVLDVFFPIAPSPTALGVGYHDENGYQILTLDLAEALRGLHLQSLEEETQ